MQLVYCDRCNSVICNAVDKKSYKILTTEPKNGKISEYDLCEKCHSDFYDWFTKNRGEKDADI